MKNTFVLLVVVIILAACSSDNGGQGPVGVSQLPDDEPIESPSDDEPAISDEELLDITQRETFKYFWDFAQKESGSARERYHPKDPSRDENVVTTGGTGFGLMAILVGIEREFVSRSEGVDRIAKILSFLENADRFHGAWSHWINGTNGAAIPFSPMDDGGDLVETAFLVQGLICVKEYLKEGTAAEKELAAKADVLWKGVEWDWYTQNENTLFWHWSPNFGFNINLELKGYNEILVTYILAASSPDFGIEKEVYINGWASNGAIESGNTKYNLPLLVKHAGSPDFGGPLFWSHYSYLGLNPKGLADDFVDYWQVNVNHSKINNAYCIENPKNFEAYGEECWGLTASYTRNGDGSIGYAAHKPGNDLGIISPTAAISSIPYTPEASLKALHYFYRNKDKLLGPAGFYDAFSPEYNFWVAEAYLAIDQGPEIIMLENYRTGLLWDLFMQNEEIQNGLDVLGFSY